jgi:predicted nucleic acid-binding protein
VTADPDDDRILECATEEGNADLIVSNHHHLLDLKSYGNIPIVAGADLRRVLAIK